MMKRMSTYLIIGMKRLLSAIRDKGVRFLMLNLILKYISKSVGSHAEGSRQAGHNIEDEDDPFMSITSTNVMPTPPNKEKRFISKIMKILLPSQPISHSVIKFMGTWSLFPKMQSSRFLAY
jgi:hypothetical protein